MNSISKLNNLLKNNKDQLTGFYKKGWNPLGLYGNTGTALKTFDAQCIYSIVKYLKCSKIVEIGTGIGFSTIYLSQAIHELNGDKLHSIDIREKSTSYTKQLLQRTGNDHLIDKIKFHTGNSKDVLPTIENNLDLDIPLKYTDIETIIRDIKKYSKRDSKKISAAGNFEEESLTILAPEGG